MKPILFNTNMVRALLEGRKTVTRRLVKSKGARITGRPQGKDRSEDGYWFEVAVNQNDKPAKTVVSIKPPYKPGDILYVRETFGFDNHNWLYKADFTDEDLKKIAGITRWLPSIHMPKKAARIFLKVKAVRTERLRDIFLDPPGPNNQIVREGFKYGCDFIAGWQHTVPKADRDKYGYDANPWVWVIEFERCERPRPQ